MAEPIAIEWEGCRISCETIQNLNIDMNESLTENPNRLIGYEELVDVFSSVISMAEYDESDNITDFPDFPDIFPETFPGARKTSAAVLLAGEAGCGRHTADKTMMAVVMSVMQNLFYAEMADDFMDVDDSELDEYLRFYALGPACFQADTDRALLRAVDAVFAQLRELTVGSPSEIFYISLGNVTHILENPKTARRFVSHLTQLTDDPRARCILTCIFDGKASALPDVLKQPFFVLEFAPPAKKYRLEYFLYLQERYPNICYAMTVDELAERTEGFTFAMVKRLGAYMLMAAKSLILQEGRKMEKYIYFATVGTDEIITVPKEKIERYIAMIRDARYVPPAPAAPAGFGPMVMPAAQFVPGVPVQAGGAEGAEKPDQGVDKDLTDEERAKKVVGGLNKPSAFLETRQGLLRPVDYAPVTLMSGNRMHPAAFAEVKQSLRSFLRYCYDSGVAKLSNIESAFYDQSTASFSVNLKDSAVLVPKENITPVEEGGSLFREVIAEGRVLQSCLQHLNLSNSWLQNRMEAHGYKDPHLIFLGICKQNGDLFIIPY